MIDKQFLAAEKLRKSKRITDWTPFYDLPVALRYYDITGTLNVVVSADGYRVEIVKASVGTKSNPDYIGREIKTIEQALTEAFEDTGFPCPYPLEAFNGFKFPHLL